LPLNSRVRVSSQSGTGGGPTTKVPGLTEGPGSLRR
jgi:hypothetical protein